MHSPTKLREGTRTEHISKNIVLATCSSGILVFILVNVLTVPNLLDFLQMLNNTPPVIKNSSQTPLSTKLQCRYRDTGSRVFVKIPSRSDIRQTCYVSTVQGLVLWRKSRLNTFITGGVIQPDMPCWSMTSAAHTRESGLEHLHIRVQPTILVTTQI